MASVKVTGFLETYEVGKFKVLKKFELLELAAKLELSGIPRTTRIRAFQREIVDFLIGVVILSKLWQCFCVSFMVY